MSDSLSCHQAEPELSTAKLFAIGFLGFLATLAIMVSLPHDAYVRWQDVRAEAYARLGWAYERIHFDPTPIDVALIGTSHTMNGIDGLAVAQTMASDGARAPDGRCLTVTNFAIPSYGRNLHWLLTQELLSKRRPKAIVLEVFENETRKAHPLFWQVAGSGDLVTAPALINLNYVHDLIRLPYRQLKLAVETASPSMFGLKDKFDPDRYDGSTVDNTRVVNVGGQALTPPLTRVIAPAKLEREAAEIRAGKDLNMLPKRFGDLEYAVPRHYVREILALADRHRVPVYLLYLPGYGQPEQPYDMSLYAGRRMLAVNDLLKHREFWHDVHHLNSAGAAPVSARLGSLLAHEPALGGAASAGPQADCAFGYPQKPVTKPYRPRPPARTL